MLHSLLSLLCMTCLILSIETIPNFVSNGDFSTPNISLSTGRISLSTPLQGWMSSAFQIGLGQVYNSRWPNTLPVLSLDNGKNLVYSQRVNLPAQGNYLLSFMYAAYEEMAFSSLGSVSVNAFSKAMSPSTSSVYEQTMGFTGTAGDNMLTLTGMGQPDGYGLTVALVKVTPANLVVNGNFDFPPLNKQFTLEVAGNILGWVSTTGTVKLAQGSLINKNWEDDVVVVDTMGASGPMTYTQTISLPASVSLMLKFTWAPGSSVAFSQQSASVSWNGQAFVLKPISNGVQVKAVQITSSPSGVNTLAITGTSPSGVTAGITLSRVILYQGSS